MLFVISGEKYNPYVLIFLMGLRIPVFVANRTSPLLSITGSFVWDKSLFDERCVKISFDLNQKLKLQVGAYDFVFGGNNKPLVVEVSYGFVSDVYDPCVGYWNENLIWHEGKTIKEEWMVELILNQVNGFK